MKNLSPIDENKDVVTKDYVDGIISETKREINVSHAVDIATVYNDISKVKNDVDVNKTTLGTQCKNLLKIVPRTITSGGVTCVIDDDGIITVNGTATETAFIIIKSNISLDETLEYTLTGTYNNLQYGYIYYQFGRTTDGTKRYNDYGNGVTFKGTYGDVTLRIPAGAVLNNVKYYPMLRYADIQDDSYEPYKPSVDERINVIDGQINVLNKNFYINYVNGKSTSDYYDYGTACSGVMIYVASEGAGVDTGGIYFINANGSLISFIQKTGIVIEIDSSNHRFRVTNNTSKMICVIAQTLIGGV